MVILALGASFTHIWLLACIFEKIQVPCIRTITYLGREHVRDTVVKGMYRIVAETMHPT